MPGTAAEAAWPTAEAAHWDTGITSRVCVPTNYPLKDGVEGLARAPLCPGLLSSIALSLPRSALALCLSPRFSTQAHCLDTLFKSLDDGSGVLQWANAPGTPR